MKNICKHATSVQILFQKFDMVTVEYLAAVALDIFVYCYYGNQIIMQVTVACMPFFVDLGTYVYYR